MEILKVCGAVLLGLIVSIFLRDQGSKLSGHISTITAISVLIYTISSAIPLISFITELGASVKNGNEYIMLLLKAGGIFLICETVSEICSSHGEKFMSTAIDYAATTTVLLSALPFIKSIISCVTELLGGIN